MKLLILKLNLHFISQFICTNKSIGSEEQIPTYSLDINLADF